MSEPTTAPSQRAPSTGGNVFTNKIGPLPMWVWLAIVAGLLVVWRLYSASHQSQSAQTTPSTPADQVPQFVNQTYTTVTAPSAPTPTPGPIIRTGPLPFPGPGPGPEPEPQPWPQPQPRPQTGPGSVTGLRSTGAGATNVGLAWNPVPGATRYQVRVTYQDKVVGTPKFTNGTSYNITGLSPNRTYGLHVVAINGNQWAPETSIVQKTT